MARSGVIAQRGDRAARARLDRYSICRGVEVRRGDGWLAVATGVRSNDMNGVVSARGALSVDLINELIWWFQERNLPSSWMTPAASAELTAALLAAGATPERTGWWMGRHLDTVLVSRQLTDVEIRRVQTDVDLEAWLDVAEGCGWIDDDGDRCARRRLYRNIGLDDWALRHWLVRQNGEAVAMASSFLDGDSVDMCNLAVIEPMRRRGIGRAVVARRLEDATRHGVEIATTAVSPDGAELYRSLAFDTEPVTPDTCFYLPLTAC